MKLADWLKAPEQKSLTQGAFGARLGVTQARVSQIANYGTRDFLMMQRIYEATGHAVTPEELVPVQPIDQQATA